MSTNTTGNDIVVWELEQAVGKVNAAHLIACHNGCAGLNPAAYRVCVEALQLWVRAGNEQDKALEGKAWFAARAALAQAEEKT